MSVYLANSVIISIHIINISPKYPFQEVLAHLTIVAEHNQVVEPTNHSTLMRKLDFPGLFESHCLLIFAGMLVCKWQQRVLNSPASAWCSPHTKCRKLFVKDFIFVKLYNPLKTANPAMIKTDVPGNKCSHQWHQLLQEGVELI